MSTVFHRILALALFAAALPTASSAPALPTAGEVEAALKRAIDATVPRAPSPGTDDAVGALFLGMLRSMEVTQVAGCVPDEAPAVTCIVRIDWGMDNAKYVPIPLQHQKMHWEAPTLSTLSALHVPVPTTAEAQAAARQFAQAQLIDDPSNEELALMASSLEITAVGDCTLDGSDGSIACDTAFRVPVGKNSTDTRQFDKATHFHLDGSEWRFERPSPQP